MSIRSRPEPVPLGLLLAAVGGYLDAYTYVGWGGVFANAQTGNVVLLAVQLARGHVAEALAHLPPLVAFLAGVAAAEVLARPGARRRLRRPARVVLVAEVLVLLGCGLVPGSTASGTAAAAVPAPGTVLTAGVTTAVAFVAALQVSTFRVMGAVAYNTTMATGNLRSLIAELARARFEREPGAPGRAAELAGVVVAFAGGAAAGALVTGRWGAPAAWVPAGALLVALATLVVQARRRESPAAPDTGTGPRDGGGTPDGDGGHDRG